MTDLGPDLRTPECSDDTAVLRHVLALIVEKGVGERQALEFGVGSGTTLAIIADVLPVTGYDGFSGLPEDWRPGFDAGMFAVSKIPQVENATVVVGLFEDTLPAYDWTDAPIALVHLDADLYSSTATALEHAGHLIQPGTYVVLDEHHGYDDDLSGQVPGERRAWEEWCLANSVILEVVGHGREQYAVKVLGFGESVES